jgi:hypothetical protein
MIIGGKGKGGTNAASVLLSLLVLETLQASSV